MDDERPAVVRVAALRPPHDYRVTELGAPPTLGASYRRALGRSAMAYVQRAGGRSRTVPRVALRVSGVRADPERLTEYQHLVGARVDEMLPSGFVHVLAFPVAMALMVRPDFPLPVLGMLHTRNWVRHEREIPADEHLTVTAWAQAPREHRRGTTVDVCVSVTDGRGVVWTASSTYLSTSVRLTGPDVEPLGEGGRTSREDGLPARTAGGERPANEELPELTELWDVDPRVIHRYAQVSGDINPIHTSTLAARAFGFPSRIAHGMYSAARALAATGVGAPLTWDVTFTSPVLTPSKVAFAQVTVAGAANGERSSSRPAQPAGNLGTESVRFMVWSPRRRKTHLTGVVRQIPPAAA